MLRLSISFAIRLFPTNIVSRRPIKEVIERLKSQATTATCLIENDDKRGIERMRMSAMINIPKSVLSLIPPLRVMYDSKRTFFIKD